MKTRLYFCLMTILFFSCQSHSELFCAVSYYGQFTQIDPQAGEIGTKRTDLPLYLQALSWSPNGILYAGTNSGQIYSINPHNGDYTLAYTLPVNGLRNMAFSSDNLLYFTQDNYLKTADLTSGNISTIGETIIIQGLAFSPEGILYGITPYLSTSKTYQLLTIDSENAVVHSIGNFSSTKDINQSLAFTSNGQLYAAGQGGFAQINPTDGTIIGTIVPVYGDYRGLEVVPEPVSCFYLALGALSIITKRKS